MIGQRVRQVRDLLDWSQQQLQDAAGIDQALISRIEGGVEPSDETLTRIASATGFPEGWFRRPAIEFPEGTGRFRKRANTSQRSNRRARRRLEVTYELVERLVDDRVRVPAVRLPLLDPPRDRNEIELASGAVREQLGLPARGPITNMTRAVERAGAIVVPLPVELERHDGLSVWPDPPKGRPVIGFRAGVPGDRERFTIAHEVGHLVLHRTADDEVRDHEGEANDFAGALLLPLADAREAFGGAVTLSHLAQLKATWGISIQALIKRAQAVGALDDARVASLFKQLSARGWRKSEPVVVHPERPALVSRLVEAVHPHGAVRDVAAMVDFPAHLLAEILSVGRADMQEVGRVLTLDKRRVASGS